MLQHYILHGDPNADATHNKTFGVCTQHDACIILLMYVYRNNKDSFVEQLNAWCTTCRHFD